MDDRYQNQTRLVKAYRWLRWKPWFYALAVARACRWAATGCKPLVISEECEYVETRWSTIDLLWSLTIAEASIKMNHLFTMEEVWPEFYDDQHARDAGEGE